MEEYIHIKGAKTHNLKNIDLKIPRNKMIVFTGLSGSGKSSLAFDTIFAEGQRRYIESLSAYARQFLRQMQKPDVEEITGLSPAISIDQKSRSNNPRSTVATVTEIYDYLRILFARVGKPHCLVCGREIKKHSNEEIIQSVIETVQSHIPKKARRIMGVEISEDFVRIYAPLVMGRKGEYYQLLYDLLGKGFEKAKIDGNLISLRERVELSRYKKHDIDALVDEILISEFGRDRRSAIERLSEAVERALGEADGLVKVEEPEPSTKLGVRSRIISSKFMCPYDGFSFPEVEPRLFSFNSPYGACPACNGLGTKHFWTDEPCPVCHGARLRPEALNVFLGDKKNIVDVTRQSVKNASEFFNKLELSKKDQEISKTVIKEIASRLKFMLNVGLDYLTLERRANTLSGGEAQRIRLASQLGSGLVGALYVLDEPTIGLHQRDNERLIKTLVNLRDLGNTIIVVEHDEDTIYSSDYIVDIGPGAGVHGGEIVAEGYLDKLLTQKSPPAGGESITLAYLRGEKTIPVPPERRDKDKSALKIRGGACFNIKNLNVEVPLGRIVAVTGVSGSGKSTFLYEILHENLRARFDKRYRSNKTFNASRFEGAEHLNRAILIDQSPIGRTPRSNPATYTGAFTFVRELFAETAEARARGWKASRFSFNVPQARGGGRCEACEGNGTIAVEMHFLPTVYVTCDICGGKRFMKETLEIKYKKKSIYECLRMTVEEALKFFEDIPAVHDRLKTLDEVGLGYLELGQSATTLSGGEAQRVKISSELYRPHLQRTIYLLDEPTVGLHYEDVKKLIDILNRLVAAGNTVVLIEHNMDIIKNADYVLDFGPEGGESGGQLLAKGTPEEIAENKDSHTGKYLGRALRLK
ncbi:excinuclease ABC subunit A [Candidatus Adlerbacteria bacterium RIFCSPHIGHO2_01_FULL_54_23]|uniref:UvrABC system protein A n=3 Tax=Candidatus Adleribacteriota TaxID=1752736 RepID=A0A1F4XZL8_9BACT|nr:MAG: Excinuclease ABC, subunit A [Candidatus Adlerbacteria bacterium GW2011_GWA1_54_10]KKW37619.1 MAG: Excinuclease ABC, subunit A [Candidatus Adlerbacteria bacterium GW2011_GWB1_54_7]OGC79591.1 MAG: excinuclease ABC subunit A [Candidatus Adlerbacteria bacterium RIFCSPHIGHO2_01_FULL_54_23]OGC86966.1 MAG: excinuclease ABC subunit A [Candidatus Adlerbacteria bacterium RIFCSPLOWO2_01_FULL_54_16]